MLIIGGAMDTIDWKIMLIFQQELHQFSRAMLVQKQKQFLTSGEREILAWIYLETVECTPLHLSKMSGMKKEAVSRCLKGLFEKGCIQKIKNVTDERSYSLFLTEKGEKELKNDYGIMLQSFYDLYREMGEEFKELFALISKANKQMLTIMEHKRSDQDEIL